jgi:hypothetical protein
VASVSVKRQEMIKFKGSHFELEVILWGVRWYVAYPISYRQLEERTQERGVKVDHSTLNRWVLKYGFCGKVGFPLLLANSNPLIPPG